MSKKNENKPLKQPAVSHSFTLNEIGDKCQKWLDEEIAKDPKDQFSNREKSTNRYIAVHHWCSGIGKRTTEIYER